jgi:hypothetical protein
MKVSTNQKAQNGSFGIPADMMAQVEKKRQEKEKVSQEEPTPKLEQAEFFPEPKVDEKKAATDEAEALMRAITPKDLFKDLGVEFTDDDFQQLLFKGFVEKDIVLTTFKKGDFTAKLRTLKTEEYDEIDEILTDEAGRVPMSTKGYESRRAVLIAAYGVTHLMGKPLSKSITLQGSNDPDRKAMALERRKTIRSLAPVVANKLIESHNLLSTAVELVVRNPGELGKNS